jgi:hypothetical protein
MSYNLTSFSLTSDSNTLNKKAISKGSLKWLYIILCVIMLLYRDSFYTSYHYRKGTGRYGPAFSLL